MAVVVVVVVVWFCFVFCFVLFLFVCLACFLACLFVVVFVVVVLFCFGVFFFGGGWFCFLKIVESSSFPSVFQDLENKKEKRE